jgi:hypothetical protein
MCVAELGALTQGGSATPCRHSVGAVVFAPARASNAVTAATDQHWRIDINGRDPSAGERTLGELRVLTR